MNKYKKQVKGVEIDVYDILHAYEVKSHSIGHAVKKLLMPGQRGSKGYEQDLKEAVQAVQRAIDDAQESVKVEQVSDEWINHNATPYFPVDAYAQVETISLEGAKRTGLACNMVWSNTVKYRILNNGSK